MKHRKATVNQIEINHFNYIPNKGIYLRRNLDVPIRTKKSRDKPSIWKDVNAWKGLFGLIVLWIFCAELIEAIFDISSLWFYGLLILIIIGRSFLKKLFLSGLVSITKKEIQVFSKSVWGFQQVKTFPFDVSANFDLIIVTQTESFVIIFQLQDTNIECYLTDQKHLIELIDALTDLLNISIENTFQNDEGKDVIRFW